MSILPIALLVNCLCLRENMFFMYYILIWSDVSQICYGLNGIYYFAWMGYYTALKYTFLYIFKPWVRVLPFCLINIFYNISLAIYCTRIFICTFYMYQIITITWDISKKLEKLSKTASVKTNNSFNYFIWKKAQWKSLPWNFFYCCYLQKVFSCFPHKLIF